MASGSQNMTSYQANKWTNLRAFTIGATAKNVDGTADISWSMNDIMGSSDSSKFYRGDKTWNNTLTGVLILDTGAVNGQVLKIMGADNKTFSFKLSGDTVAGSNVDIGWDWTAVEGAGAAFRSTSFPSQAGEFRIFARKKNSSNTAVYTQLIGTAGDTTNGGTLTWGENIIPTTGNNTGSVGSTTGPVYINNGVITACTTYANATVGAANKLATARAINGTDFDGSAAITTANWGTSRTLTIGATGKSVNGSANVSWSMDEIMGSSTSAYFYRGDKTWSNDLVGSLNLQGNLTFTNSGTAFRGINYGTMGDNDQWRIGGAATASNGGYMEIATADDGNEPIYVRQYTGVFSSVTRTLTLLDSSGNTTLPGNISIGSRVTSTQPSSLVSIARITIIPYYHTSGPWYIYSQDDASNAYLSLYYSGTRLIEVKHNGNMVVAGPATDSVGAIHVIDSRTDAGWHYPLLGTCASLAENGNMYLCIGKSASTGNAAGLRYQWAGASSNSNLMGFEFYGQGTKLWVYANGNGGVSGEWSAGTHIKANNGYLYSTANSNTVTIGSQNTSWCHFQNSADIQFYFNKGVRVDGTLGIYNANTYMNANDIVANRYVYATYFNASCGAETPNDAAYWIYANSDGWFRKSSRANAVAKMDLEHKWVRLAGDTMTGLLTVTSDASLKGIKVGSNYINAIGDSLIIQNCSEIRFGTNAWDWNCWAGMRYDNTNKHLYIGMAHSPLVSNSDQYGYITLAGIRELYFQNGGTTWQGIRSTIGDNDYWRVGGAATASNAGYMELATADDGTEPIYVRQYTGVFSSLTRTLTLLDGSGNTTFPGVVSISSPGSNRATLNLVSVADVPNDFWLGANNTNKWSITCRASNESYFLGFYSASRGGWNFRMYHDGNNYNDGELHVSGWVRFANWTGLYSPNNSAHFYPNNSTSYGAWQMQGTRGGYYGLVIGPGTQFLHLMDSGEHKGLYEEDQRWILYYQRSTQRIGLMSADVSSGYSVQVNGSLYVTSTFYAPSTCYTDNNIYCHGLWANRSDGEKQVGVDNGTAGTLYLWSNSSEKGIYSSSGYRTGYVIRVTSSATTFYGNCTGSSASCTGNAATATTASSCSGNAATATTASYITTPNTAGFSSDQFFNLTHLRSNATDNWNIKNSAGTAKFTVYPETGDVVITGALTLNGTIYTSFGGAAMCSYGSSQTTVGNLLGELRYSNGATGSANITTAYSATAGGTISSGWYNYIYSPHRVGGLNGGANGDNHGYGSCILAGMTVESSLWYIRYSWGISESRRIWLAGNAVTNAVWNDLAECRKSEVHAPGYAITQAGKYTTKRLEPGCRITSDTWGFALGNEKDKDKMPVAISGRVLAYPYRSREEYHLGDCVCSAPNGKVDIMTRQEIRDWPDCIIGIVNEIPDYDEWGSDEEDNTGRKKIKVNGRIWIDIK